MRGFVACITISLVAMAFMANLAINKAIQVKAERDSYRHQFELACKTNASLQRIMRYQTKLCPEYAEFLVRAAQNQQKTVVDLIRTNK